MELVIDGRSMAVRWPSGVPVTDLSLVLGDTVPLRIRVDHALTDCTPALAVKQTIGSPDLIMTVTGWTREDDWHTASWVVNTAPLQAALGSADSVTLVAEVVLVSPDGAQHTSRPIRVTVRRDILPAEFAPPAEVLADWNNLVDASLAARLPDALHDAGVYLTPVPGAATLTVEGGTLPYALGCYLLPLSAPAVIGHLAGHYSINRLTITAPASHNNGTAWMMRLWRYADGAMSELGTSTDQATWADTAEAAQQACSWDFSGVEVAAADVLVMQIYDAAGSSKQMQGCARQMDQGAGMGICSIVSGVPQITHPCAMGITLDTTYQDGVSVGGTELASKSHFDALAAEVRDTLPQVNQAADDAGTARDDAQASMNAALNYASDAADAATAAQQALAAIPQVDGAGNMAITGGMTTAGTINANGGLHIPLAVGTPTDTAAVNRLYAAGLAFASECFSLPSYPLKSYCSATGEASFDDTLAPVAIGLRVPAGTAASAMINFVELGHTFHNYSGTRGFAFPVYLPQVSCKVTLPIYKVPFVFRPGLEMDSFTLVPSTSSLFFGEILDITFNPVRDADAGGYHVRVREVYWSKQETMMKVKTTHSLVKEGENQRIPLCVAKIVYEQYRDGGLDTEERGALWLVHSGSTATPCIKIATVRGAHCYEQNSLGRIYLDIDKSGTTGFFQIQIGTLTQHIGMSGLNPAYYGFSAMETNAIVSESVEDFNDPEI